MPEVGTKDLKWEHLVPGRVIASQTYLITLDDIREEAEAYEDYDPKSAIRFGRTYKDVFSGHINAIVSEGQFGVASMPVQGAVVESGVTPLIVNWLRSTKPWLYGGRQESKFIQIVLPGDTLVYHGTVKEKRGEGPVKQVVVDVYAENQKGEKVMVGTATVSFQV